MTGVEIGVVSKALASVVLKPAISRLSRQEGVIRLLHRFGLKPTNPPNDFNGVYIYALVEFCYGKPAPIVAMFENEYVREAFKRSFETADLSHLNREVQNIIQWNDETGQLGYLDYNMALEVTGFSAVFNRLVSLTRNVAEIQIEHKIDGIGSGVNDIQVSLSDLIDRLDRTTTREEILRQGLSAPLTPVQKLENDVREWFNAVEYKIERKFPNSAGFCWLVRVPARRGYDNVFVCGQGGELSAPDVQNLREKVRSHGAREGWAIVPSRISEAARVADENLTEIFCYTFDELIDERADFEPYLAWLDQQISEKRIDERYVTLSCMKEEPDQRSGKVDATSIYSWRNGGLNDYVSRWVEDDSKEHLSILGQFGTGKTWFTLSYAWQLSLKWREAKAAGRRRPRLPLVVPLRDYAKAVSIESLFSEFFFRKHEILPDGYRVFEALNRLGKLLLVFDGFDEMAAKVDRQSMINNFWELARAVVPGAKVLLTCRTEHFPEARQGRELLRAQLKASTSALTGEPPQFEVVEVLPFDRDQVQLMLSHVTNPETVERIIGTPELLNLIRRPVMCDLVLGALPEIEAGAKVDMSRVYLYAVRRKIDHDIKEERTFTSLTDKVYFLCQLSWYMLANDIMSLNYREFPDRIRECFGDAVAEQRDLDHWHYDMMGQTLLVRNSSGDYSPAHRSLLEFFAAYKVVAELGRMNADFIELAGFHNQGETHLVRWSSIGKAEPERRSSFTGWEPETFETLIESLGQVTMLTSSVAQFAGTMFDSSAPQALVNHIRSTRGKDRAGVNFFGAACAHLAIELNRGALAGADLSGTVLAGALLDRGMDSVDLSNTNLAGADLYDVGEFSQWKHLPRRVRRISRRASSNYGSYGVGR